MKKMGQSKKNGTVGAVWLLGVLLLSVCFSHGAELRPVSIAPVSFIIGSTHASDQRNYQGVPAIAIAPGGRLWAAYLCGPKGEDIYNYVIVATSGDGGKTWEEKFVIDPDGDGPKRAAETQLWLDPDGKLWLFWWLQGPGGCSVTMAMTTENPDDGNPVWSESRPLFPGVMLNKPIVTSKKEWLMPSAKWHQEGSSRVYVSDDLGETFTLRGAATVPNAADRNCDEPMIVERDDGSLLMLVRTSYGIGRSESTDNGRTWTDVEPSGLPHTPARIFIYGLASGRILLVKHGPIVGRPVGRRQLRAFLSEDGGRSWSGGLMIDERLSSYPCGVQAKDGTIYVIYDRERYTEREVLMAKFTEDDVLAGEAVSERANFRMLVNRAVGPEIPWEPGDPWPPEKKTEVTKASDSKIAAEDAPVEIWVGKGGGNNFRINENWKDGSFPMSGAKLVFSGTARTSPNNNNKPGMKISGITFAPDAGAFKVTGTAVNPIELVGEIVNESKFTQVLRLPIVFSGEQVIYANTGDIRIEGQISGECTLVKTGESTLILAAENDYKGITHVKSGTLRAETATLPAHGEIRIEGPGFLELAFKGVNSTKTLYISGEKQTKGVWGAMGSDAEFQNPHITGTGTLKVAE